jgi:signal transduction histidine kinase
MFNKLTKGRYYFLTHWLIQMDSWGVLCALFTLSFVLAKANFTSELADRYLFSWIFSLGIAAIAAILMHGGFRMLFRLNIEHKNAFIINSFVLNSHIDPDISDENLRELFNQVKIADRKSFSRVFFYASFVVVVPILIMLFAADITLSNLIIITIGGFFGDLFFAISVLFSSSSFWGDLLKECRKVMKERNMPIEEKPQLITLKNGFYYFIFLFLWITIIILSFIPNPNMYLLFLIFTGITLGIYVTKVLFSSIFSVFEEIREFAGKLPKEEKTEYSSGSYYREITSLSKDLTASAAKVYEARIMEKKAHEDLKELDGAKTQFILATEHHLRTPLTISKGYLDSFLMKKGSTLDDEGRSYLNKVKDATARITDLVNELLEISQMEVGKSVLKMESVNIKDLIMDIVSNFKFDMDAKQIRPVYYFSEENNILSLNKEKITEALSNIVSNAVKYNKMGGELKVSGKIVKNENNQKFYQLFIEDQGIGINPENISKIFTQYFERGEEARKVYATGRGIGLVIAKNIIKAHQGTIRAESEGEGRGSRFVIELPIQ